MSWHTDGGLHFALGIEDTFVPQSRPGERPIDEYELTEHYRHWHADLGLAAEAGATMVRWGVPWHRVSPERGRWDFGWVDRVMDRFGELGLEPLVDLVHYGTPLWLEGQFAHPDYAQVVSEYAATVADRYRSHARTYTPVNEPMIHAQFTGQYGYWPPCLTGQDGLAKMALAVARGFVHTQHAVLDVVGEHAVFLHVDAGFRYTGDVDAPEHRHQVALMREQRYLVEDLVTGRVTDAHPLRSWLADHGATDEDLAFFLDRPAHPDVMGVNYYPKHSTEVFEVGVHHGGGFADPRPCRDDGVLGLREVLAAYADRYGAPVMLSETCVTGSVDERSRWLAASVDEVVSLARTGLPVAGYTWWPVFDMYEWTYRHSLDDREAHRLAMGLWSLDERHDDLVRVPTPLVTQFRTLARRYARSLPTPTPTQ